MNMSLNTLKKQSGRFSPFMFGMLIGISVFGGVVSHWSKQELANMEEDFRVTKKKYNQDVKNSLETAILIENVADASNTYSNTLDIARSRKSLSVNTGKTRGGADYQFITKNTSLDNGIQNKRIIISTSDDSDLNTEIASLLDSTAISAYSTSQEESVGIFDSKEVRQRQINTSMKYMRMEESQLYRFYSANGFRFPADQTEYNTKVNNITLLKDAWGTSFVYTYTDDKTSSIKFTTPWGYIRTINLDMN